MHEVVKAFPAFVRKKISDGVDQMIDFNEEIISSIGLTPEEARGIILAVIAGEAFNLLYEEQKRRLK